MKLGLGAHGRVLHGRYRLERRAGEGAAGQVWQATDLLLNRVVAVKVLAEPHRESERLKMRLLDEAEAGACVRSAHVASVFDCAAASEIGPYIVMEFVDGVDLYTLLSHRGMLQLDQAVTIAAQLCLALDAVHAAGWVHRDVKPENVAVCRRGGRLNVKLVDFGIATPLGGQGPPSRCVRIYGTPAYMSPERLAAAGPPDTSDDLWSLAVLTYLCLVGRLPFDDATYVTLWTATNGGAFPRPTALRPELPAALDAWLVTCLAPRPEDRFASVVEMREALIRACEPWPLSTRRERAWFVPVRLGSARLALG
jgi:serine/threonine protein kinase